MTVETPHHRDHESLEFEHKHKRSGDTALGAVIRILGLPIGTLAAIAALVVALFGAWLAHDRAIVATQTQETRSAERITKLENTEEERRKQDQIVSSALIRIETKLDDLTDRVERDSRYHKAK